MKTRAMNYTFNDWNTARMFADAVQSDLDKDCAKVTALGDGTAEVVITVPRGDRTSMTIVANWVLEYRGF